MTDCKCGEIIHGFVVTRVREVPDQNGTLYEFLHEKSGLQAMWLKTNDTNKLFSIAFKTIPEDDTGVFHILEHSVLCGSKKYPVKEPFLELMKSSMNTFLNAMTFPDKTLYPVASRNDKDLQNLARVYLDAVFAPSIYENPNIFYQEGWHYDISSEEEMPQYQGVVLNEMKGAESALDSVVQTEIMGLLYPDSPYRFVSGGRSAHIPDLTYEQFLSMHRKYYCPSNAIVYMEGDLDPTTYLSLTAEYLQEESEKRVFEIPMQQPTEAEEKTVRYAVDEDCEDRCHAVFSKIACSWDEKEKMHAIMVLSSYLADSMEAPLKWALLEQGFAQDVRVWLQDSVAQPSFTVWVCNTNKEHFGRIKEIITETIASIISEGIDKAALEAIINQMEFMCSEPDEPKGLTHNVMVLDSVLYGGDPIAYLTYTDTFRFLRRQLETDYYEKLLSELFSENGMKTLYLLPDASMQERMSEAESEKLAREKSSWSDEELREMILRNEKLLSWQTTEDSPENLSTMPKLSVSDIPLLPEKFDTTVTETDGVKVLLHPAESENTAFINLYFEAEDAEHLSALTYLPNLIGKLPTSSRGPGEIYQDIQKNLGDLSFEMLTSAQQGDLEHCRVYFAVRCSVLKKNIPEAVRIIRELLLETDFTQEQHLYMVLLQLLESTREDIIANGHTYAMYRSAGGFSAENAAKEAFEGISANRYITHLCKEFDAEKDIFIRILTKAQKELFCKARLTISVTAKNAEEIPACDFISAFPDGLSSGKPLTIAHEKTAESFIPIPAEVSYGAMSTNLFVLGAKPSGRWKVAAKLLSLRDLWTRIRVQGGAYGAGMQISDSGNLTCYSYRDPNPENSLACFAALASYIREFCESDENMEQYLISTIADTEPVLTQQAKGTAADIEYLRGITFERKCTQRREILETKKEDLAECAEILDNMGENFCTCIAGSERNKNSEG